MRRFRRALILLHRYLGIALGLLVVMWFASGITMIYAGGMPELTDAERREARSDLDLERVRLTPGRAAADAGLDPSPGSVRLLMLGDRPVYHFGGAEGPVVYADSGRRIGTVDGPRARELAAGFAEVPPDAVRHVGLLRRADQWTLTHASRLPLHKLRIEDEAGTEVYVSARTGQVVQRTTRSARALAWVSAIPHWLYVTPLRARFDLWNAVILATSGLACLLVVAGLVLAVVHFRFARPFRISRIARHVPYRGWMRWHYWLGAIFGIFALTWLFSGLLSMEPLGWAAGEGLASRPIRESLRGGALSPDDFPASDPESWNRLFPGEGIDEIEYVRVLDRPYFRARVSGRERPVLVDAERLRVRREPFSDDLLAAAVRRAHPDAPLLDVRRLEEHDSYHYGRDGEAVLPVLRLRFADPRRTWVYVDPASGELVRSVHARDRLERWIYNGFHSLDFSFWYDERPLWDLGMIVLLLGGLGTSGIGLYLGLDRLRRKRASDLDLRHRERAP